MLNNEREQRQMAPALRKVDNIQREQYINSVDTRRPYTIIPAPVVNEQLQGRLPENMGDNTVIFLGKSSLISTILFFIRAELYLPASRRLSSGVIIIAGNKMKATLSGPCLYELYLLEQFYILIYSNSWTVSVTTRFKLPAR